MPRKPRIDVAGAIHHVWARGNRRQAIFTDDADRLEYLGLLEWVVRRTGWSCMSYCLMHNHVHLLLETPSPNLSRGMQILQGDYATEFNRRHSHAGHLYQGRFGSNLVEDDEELLTIAGYIALNPVEAGLCRHAADWPWSSYGAAMAGDEPRWLDLERLHGVLAAAGGDPRRRYAELVEPSAGQAEAG